MSNYPDVFDPLSAPPSQRYEKYNACEGLKFHVEENEKVLWITLNRPSKVNSITQRMYNALNNVCDELLMDRQIRVVVLAAEGKNFSAGLDFDSAYQAGGDGAGPKDVTDSLVGSN
jgi:enoyl-CoA hydratase/carnithine racemase